MDYIKLLVLIGCAAVHSYALPVEDTKIVGGFFAEINQFPHQISLQTTNGFHLCGGSIINSKYVITAAHCVDGASPASRIIVAGTTFLSKVGKRFSINKITVHENYGNFQNDIALIKINIEFTFDESIQPIRIRTTEVPDDSKIIISGWGAVSTTGNIPDHLKYNFMYKENDDECHVVSEIFFNGLMCFKNDVDNGACFGDSGGPATFENELIGIANFIIGSCGSKNPDGYAKVSYFIDWIIKNIT